MSPMRRRAGRIKRTTAGDLAAVAAAMREIGRSENARASIARAVCDLTGAELAGVLEPGGQDDLVLTGAHGAAGPVAIRLEARSAGATAFLSGRHVFVSDVAEPLRDRGVASALYEPVVLDDKPVGVLFAAWDRRVKRLEDRSLSVMRLLAAEAAFAMERADLTARLERLARTDELTGLANRRTADEELGRFLARARRDGAPLSVAMLEPTDVRPGDDRLLQTAAKAWSATLPAGDLLARYGGETFVAFFPRCGLDDAGIAAERLR